MAGIHRNGWPESSVISGRDGAEYAKWMVAVDGKDIPLGSALASAWPTEVTIVDQSLEQIKVERNGRGRPKSRPKRLIADKGYDTAIHFVTSSKSEE